jgi:heme/copper-type cytochrome/quinol oxidase subunit 2
VTRLRSFAATAGQARVRSFAATAGQARLRSCAATARQACTTAAAVVIGGTSSVLACPMCFGAEETSMVDGTKLGIMVMLGITLVVQGGFVGFFLYLRKRAKRMAEIELDTEWSELQRART